MWQRNPRKVRFSKAISIKYTTYFFPPKSILLSAYWWTYWYMNWVTFRTLTLTSDTHDRCYGLGVLLRTVPHKDTALFFFSSTGTMNWMAPEVLERPYPLKGINFLVNWKYYTFPECDWFQRLCISSLFACYHVIGQFVIRQSVMRRLDKPIIIIKTAF